MPETRRLRATFESAAALYDKARPGYPEALFDDTVSLSGIPPGGRILEIGCGTGIATIPFARRGYEMLCVELGERLAAVARENLAPYPRVRIETGAFEDWDEEPETFDLAFAATAFHWIEQPAGYQKIARALKPGGAVAIFRHHHVQTEQSGDFWDAVQAHYQRYMPGTPKGFRLPTPDVVADFAGDIEQTGLFGPVSVRRYVWNEHYTAAEYLNLLRTFSSHIELEQQARNRLFQNIARMIDSEYGGRITKGHLSILHVARCRR